MTERALVTGSWALIILAAGAMAAGLWTPAAYVLGVALDLAAVGVLWALRSSS
jgi:hypothetical protein